MTASTQQSKQTRQSNIIQSVGLLILLGIVWGSGYSLAKYATTNGVPFLGYSFWQSLGPAIVLTIYNLARYGKLPLQKQHLIFYLVCGLIGIAIPNSLMYYTAAHLPAGILAVIVNTVPIIIYPLALLLQQELFSALRLLAVLLGATGIIFIVLPHGSLPSLQFTGWALITLLVPLAFASCALYINKAAPNNLPAPTMASGMMIASTILLTPWTIASHSFYPLTYPLSLAELTVILEIILSSLGYVIFFRLLTIAGPVYYSLVGGVVALTGIFWGHVLFQEHMNTWNIIAALLIFSAIVILSITQKPTFNHN